MEAYRYKEPKRCKLYEFDQWLSSLKTHQSAMHAFVEFECRFAQLSERDQRLVGVEKVLMFVKSIDRKERNAIGIRLEDDDGANGLTEDWTKVERVCRLHDERKARFSSVTTQRTRDGEKRTGSNYKLPPKEENSKREGSTILDIEVLMEEAFENLKAQVEAEEKLQKEQKLKQMMSEEVKAKTNTCKEEGRIIEDCSIEKVNGYEADEFEEMATNNELEMEVAMDNTMKEDGKCAETSSPLFQDIWAMVDGNISVGGERAITEEIYPNQIKTQEMEGGNEEVKVNVDIYDEEVKQSTMVHDNGQASQVKSKDILRDMITCSDSKGDSSVKIKQTMVNCHTRAYHEKGGCGKHEMWSSQILKVSVDLKHGLQGVVKVNVQVRSNEDKPRLMKEGRLNCVNHGDGRNKGSTCMMHEGLCFGKAEEDMKTKYGNAKLRQRIWWFGWSPWLWWKEWSWWHWKKKDKEPTSWFKVNLYHR